MNLDRETQKFVNRFVREIERKKIRTPKEGEYVGPCQWSKTGWAIWETGGACTCEPAREPKNKIGSES